MDNIAGYIVVGVALALLLAISGVGVWRNERELRERARRGTKKKEKV